MNFISTRTIGFRANNAAAYRAYNVTAAALLILAILPLLAMISLLLFATQGRNIIYRGPRLGENEKVFHILKFRTLCEKRARELTKDRTLPKDSNIETPLGGFLRDTRLDEMPQLFNVLKGDMNICGPRPVRGEIAAIERKRIPGYAMRFSVKPGLVGPTQAYFGHGASKRLRARMNNRLVQRPVNILAELALLGRIGFSIVTKLSDKLARRRARGARPPRRDMWLATESGDRLASVEHIGLRNIFVPDLPGAASGDRAVLYIRLRSGALRKARIVLSEPEKRGVYGYTAETEFAEFTIERYALRLVVVPPQLRELRLDTVGSRKPKQQQVCA